MTFQQMLRWLRQQEMARKAAEAAAKRATEIVQRFVPQKTVTAPKTAGGQMLPPQDIREGGVTLTEKQRQAAEEKKQAGEEEKKREEGEGVYPGAPPSLFENLKPADLSEEGVTHKDPKWYRLRGQLPERFYDESEMWRWNDYEREALENQARYENRGAWGLDQYMNWEYDIEKSAWMQSAKEEWERKWESKAKPTSKGAPWGQPPAEAEIEREGGYVVTMPNGEKVRAADVYDYAELLSKMAQVWKEAQQAEVVRESRQWTEETRRAIQEQTGRYTPQWMSQRRLDIESRHDKAMLDERISEMLGIYEMVQSGQEEYLTQPEREMYQYYQNNVERLEHAIKKAVVERKSNRHRYVGPGDITGTEPVTPFAPSSEKLKSLEEHYREGGYSEQRARDRIAGYIRRIYGSEYFSPADVSSYQEGGISLDQLLSSASKDISEVVHTPETAYKEPYTFNPNHGRYNIVADYLKTPKEGIWALPSGDLVSAGSPEEAASLEDYLDTFGLPVRFMDSNFSRPPAMDELQGWEDSGQNEMVVRGLLMHLTEGNIEPEDVVGYTSGLFSFEELFEKGYTIDIEAGKAGLRREDKIPATSPEEPPSPKQFSVEEFLREATDEQGYVTPRGWYYDGTTDVITPNRWLVDDDGTHSAPFGVDFTPEEMLDNSALLGMFGDEFDPEDIDELADWIEFQPKRFVELWQSIGMNPESVAVLKELGLTDEQIKVIFPEYDPSKGVDEIVSKIKEAREESWWQKPFGEMGISPKGAFAPAEKSYLGEFVKWWEEGINIPLSQEIAFEWPTIKTRELLSPEEQAEYDLLKEENEKLGAGPEWQENQVRMKELRQKAYRLWQPEEKPFGLFYQGLGTEPLVKLGKTSEKGVLEFVADPLIIIGGFGTKPAQVLTKTTLNILKKEGEEAAVKYLTTKVLPSTGKAFTEQQAKAVVYGLKLKGTQVAAETGVLPKAAEEVAEAAPKAPAEAIPAGVRKGETAAAADISAARKAAAEPREYIEAGLFPGETAEFVDARAAFRGIAERETAKGTPVNKIVGMRGSLPEDVAKSIANDVKKGFGETGVEKRVAEVVPAVERRATMGAKPPTTPPAPPTAAAGAMPAKEKLMSLVKSAESIRPTYEAMKKTERVRRLAMAKAASEAAGGGTKGFKAALKAMGGEMPAPEFITDVKLLAGDVDELHRAITDFAKTSFDYDVAGAGSGLQKLFTGKIPEPKELELLERVFGPELTNAVRKLSPDRWELVLDIAGIPRSVQTSADLSFTWRQGAVAFWKNPIEGFKTIGRGAKAFAKEKWAKELDDFVRNHELYELATSSRRPAQQRLYLPEYGGTARVAKREEPFMTRLAQYIPGIKHAERAYVTMGNKFRIDALASDVKRLRKAGITIDDSVAGTLAEWINIHTGRGDLGRLNSIAPALNQVLYSLRYQVSRLQMPFKWARLPAIARKSMLEDLHMKLGNEVWAGISGKTKLNYHAQLGKVLKSQKWKKITLKKSKEEIRALLDAATAGKWKEMPATIRESTLDTVAHFFAGPNWQVLPRELMRGAIFDLVRWFTATSAILGGGYLGFKAMGKDVSLEFNPLSSDFGKLRVGNTRLDMGAGMVQWFRFMSQLVMGIRKDTETGGYTSLNRGKLIQTYTRQKSAPVPAFITDLCFGETSVGEELEGTPAGVGKIAKDRLLPMVLNDFWDAFEEDGWIGLAAAAPALFGGGIVAYHREPTEKLNSWIYTLENQEDQFQDLILGGKEADAWKVNEKYPLLNMQWDGARRGYFSDMRRGLDSYQSKINAIKADYNRIEKMAMPKDLKQEKLKALQEEMDRIATEALDRLERYQGTVRMGGTAQKSP